LDCAEFGAAWNQAKAADPSKEKRDQAIDRALKNMPESLSRLNLPSAVSQRREATLFKN